MRSVTSCAGARLSSADRLSQVSRTASRRDTEKERKGDGHEEGLLWEEDEGGLGRVGLAEGRMDGSEGVNRGRGGSEGGSVCCPLTITSPFSNSRLLEGGRKAQDRCTRE